MAKPRKNSAAVTATQQHEVQAKEKDVLLEHGGKYFMGAPREERLDKIMMMIDIWQYWRLNLGPHAC
jgi:hypothetical protein